MTGEDVRDSDMNTQHRRTVYSAPELLPFSS